VRYLITGGAGFIGSHLADAVLSRGDSVAILDDLSTGRPANVNHLLKDSRVIFRRGSILDQQVVREEVEGADLVVHLAAAVGVRLIMERPLESFVTNIRGTEIVLEECLRLGRTVLVASTSEVYGKNAEGPLPEDSDRVMGPTFKERWSYATSKSADETMAHLYWSKWRLPTIVARLFNCVGPRQTGAYGMVIPRFVRQALVGEDLTVYGDGEQLRCFCHVGDTVRALLALLDDPRAQGDFFNVGSTEEITINQLAERVIEATDSSSRVVHIPYEAAFDEGFEDMRRRLPDISKIRGLVGWEPTLRLDEILSDVIAHERAHPSPTPAGASP
jgi:nucleoside-diphosphate-sugar epimerase